MSVKTRWNKAENLLIYIFFFHKTFDRGEVLKILGTGQAGNAGAVWVDGQALAGQALRRS